MRKAILLILLLPLMTVAQTQTGLVKTRGRMVNGVLQKGTPIAGATVQVKDRSAMVSGSDGTFSFPLRTGTYFVQSVRKQGYQLVDQEVCRDYKYSASPLYLVMETPEQQQSDMLAAEKKIRRNMQRQLQQKEDEIEALQASQQEKDSLLRILYEQQGDNEKLIADMVKRYSTLDYDQLDEFYRQVSWFIENGELKRADSLLRTRGDLRTQVRGILQQGQAIEEQKEQLVKAEEVHRQDIDEAARRCYGYYETFSAQHLRDSAAYYIELRASLDTTNLDWLTDAGMYNVFTMARYDRALEYFQNALRQALLLDSGKNMGVAAAYNNIGLTYASEGSDNVEALEYLLKGMRLVEELNGTKNEEVACCYDNVASVYGGLDLRELSMSYHLKTLAIREELQSEDIDVSYHGLGVCYKEKEDFAQALEYLLKAYELSKEKRGEKNRHTADYMNSIGDVYLAMTDIPTALDYYTKTLDIRKEIYDENHPDVASSYKTIGHTYHLMEDYAQALFFYQKALSVWEQRHDEKLMAVECYNLATIYKATGQYGQALEFLKQSLQILGEDGNDAIGIYNTMSEVYLSLQDSIRAAECRQKVAAMRSQYTATGGVAPDLEEAETGTIADYAKKLNTHLRTLAVIESALGPEYDDVAEVCAAISLDCNYLRDTNKAEAYQTRSLTLRRQLYGENSLKVADSYLYCAMTALQRGESGKALDLIYKAKAIKSGLLGADHPEVASAETWEGMAYIKTGQWDKLIECFKHVLVVKEKTWGAEHIYSTDIIERIGQAYFELGDYQSALSSFQHSLKIKERFLGPNHSIILRTKGYIEDIEETIRAEEKKEQEAQRIREQEVITLTPLEDGDSPARQQGMAGEYVVLEFCGWHIGDEQSFVKTFNAYQTQPKDIVVIKDGIITKHHFEAKIGAWIKTKDLTKEEKQLLKEAYEKWSKF